MANEDDIDRWSDEVAGRRAPSSPDLDGTAALRRAIVASDDAARSAGAGDRVGLERLMRRLEAERLLEAPPARVPARSRRAPPWLAVAATVAALAIGVRLYLPQPGVEPGGVGPPPIEKPRGFAGVVKQSVPDPEASAQAASAELQALGLRAQRVAAEGRVILEVDVDAARLDAYRGWVEPRGGRVGEPGRYRIIFEPSS